MENQTAITEILLLGFGDFQPMQVFLFLLFLFIYIMTAVGNILIIVLVAANQHLHTPMYFFEGNLSCLETCYSSTLLPRMLASFLSSNRTISVSGCIAQFYFFGCLAGTECFLLSVMSYDRYSAICNPLRYAAIMNNKVCFILATGSWLGGFAVNTIIVSFMSKLTFCRPNAIDHFFCDFAPLIELSCSDTHLVTLVDFIFSTICAFPPFLLTLASYICIITTILKIPFTSGKQKAFSTCSSHLVVVTSFFGTLILVYVVPSSHSVIDAKKMFSLSSTQS
ncbi:olfactory receptor 1020-like [Hemicordylus capensis]|uniref:olfactory receptor 1020-like n=1 Tax=Hemicordylus capensis TaxID=884348 RepID=UPI002302BD3C|nr:olfactory receptor 1020-like [Hemicordylus capensis]